MSRVLFLHGLESSPHGSKVRLLRAQGFDVVAPDLQMGLFTLERKNSALRSALRHPEPWLWSGAVLGLAAFAPGWALATAAVVAGARRKAVAARALGDSFDACVAIAQAALEEARPDVVVGSSWGGAVAAAVGWDAPTVLLAPAVHKVAQWARRAPRFSAGLKAVVFHDPADATVPFADSEALARACPGVELRSVDAGGHRLMGLLERGELAAELRRLSSA